MIKLDTIENNKGEETMNTTTRLEEAIAEHAAGHMSDHQYANERAIAAHSEALAACRSVTPTTADEKAAWDAFWATK